MIPTPAEKQLAGALHRIEAELRSQFRAVPPEVRRILALAAFGQGKRLRARLVWLSAHALGSQGQPVERLAAAFELLHQATLVHDDVIDASQRRRHRLTLNARFGNATAVLAGDLIFVKAIRLLDAGHYSRGVQSCVVQAAAAVCVGELQELRHQDDLGLTLAEYFAIVGNKTASLLSAACECGARLAGASWGRIASLARYGREFGIAFQIRDDLLDLTGGVQRLGKPVGQDLAGGRMTLPLILGLRRTRGAERRGLQAYLRPGNRRGLAEALAGCGALDAAGKLAQTHARRAKAALRSLPPSAAREALAALADFAVERNH